VNVHRIEPPASRTLRLAAGTLLIVVPAAFMAFFTALQMRFDYPDILRRPAAEVLTRFAANEGSLVPLWYGMFASALLFIPLSLTIAALHRGSRLGTMSLAAIGVLAGLVQAVGLARWVFVVPMLASRFTATTAPQDHASIAVVFDTLNQLLGVGIGEHMGYIFTAAWTLLVAWTMRVVRPIAALIGAASALGIAAGLLEPMGVPIGGVINAVAYSAWSLWLVWLSVLLLVGKNVFPGHAE
jgi:hypothetical protein